MKLSVPFAVVNAAYGRLTNAEAALPVPSLISFNQHADYGRNPYLADIAAPGLLTMNSMACDAAFA
jgi:hypothetical protein